MADPFEQKSAIQLIFDFGENVAISSGSETAESLEEEAETKLADEEDSKIASEAYLGCLQPADAEKRLLEDATFGLYHKNDGTISLSLTAAMHIVYRTANGSYKHFAIESIHRGGRTYYHVEKDSRSPSFASIGRLVHYYRTYCLLRQDIVEALPV